MGAQIKWISFPMAAIALSAMAALPLACAEGSEFDDSESQTGKNGSGTSNGGNTSNSSSTGAASSGGATSSSSTGGMTSSGGTGGEGGGGSSSSSSSSTGSSSSSASSSSSSSASSSSSSSGGGTCDGTGDCVTCQGCADTSTCQAEYNTCINSLECTLFFTCIDGCAGDPVCYTICELGYPQGAVEADNYAYCVVCNACFADCDGANSGC